MSFPRNSAVRPPSILKPIARVLNGTSPVVMFGAVETDSCSNFRERFGRKVQIHSTGSERSEVSQGVLRTLEDPSEGPNFRAVGMRALFFDNLYPQILELARLKTKTLRGTLWL